MEEADILFMAGIHFISETIVTWAATVIMIKVTMMTMPFDDDVSVSSDNPIGASDDHAD